MLSIAAIINMAFVVAFHLMGSAIILLIFLCLGIPVLLPLGLVILAFCWTMGRKEWRKAIPELSACMIILLLPVFYAFVVYPLMNRQVFFFELPDGTEMTVWEDYIVFDHYDSFRTPKDNYIYMGKDRNHYAISISDQGELSAWVNGAANEIAVCNPRFPLVGIYEGQNNGGRFWFDKETPITSTYVKLTYLYMHDGLASAGDYDYSIVRSDSVEFHNWYFPGIMYYQLKESTYSPWALAIDSVARRDSIDMAQDMKFFHYQDSVQHSQLSATYPQKGTHLWQKNSIK